MPMGTSRRLSPNLSIILKDIVPKMTRRSGQRWEKGNLHSQIFKQKTTPHCLVTRKRIAWTRDGNSHQHEYGRQVWGHGYQSNGDRERGGCSSQHETMDVARSEPQGRAVTMRTLFTWQSGIDLLLTAFGVSRHLLGFRQIFCIPRWTAQPGIFYQECESQGAMRVCKLKRFLL